jgi:hypothetical protein
MKRQTHAFASARLMRQEIPQVRAEVSGVRTLLLQRASTPHTRVPAGSGAHQCPRQRFRTRRLQLRALCRMASWF